MNPPRPPPWLLLVPRGQLTFILYTGYVGGPVMALGAVLDRDWLMLGLIPLLVGGLRDIRATVHLRGQPAARGSEPPRSR